MRIFTALTIAAVFGGAAFAQESSDEAARLIKLKVESEISSMANDLVFTMAAPGGPAVKNQPYSADASTETTQTLANGTHIHRTNGYSIYRDSEGRQRREIKNSDGEVEEVTISDPVAGVNYSLNMKEQVARKIARPNVGVAYRTVPDGATAKAGGQVSVMTRSGDVTRGNGEGQAVNVTLLSGVRGDGADKQSLGTQMINGVAAEGTRITRTIPVGSIGNDQPIETLNESWFSAELQTVVMTKRSDPRSGDTVFELKNIRRSEPDPSLFQVPASFKFVTQR